MVDFSSLLKKIVEIYGEEFLYENHFATPVEYHGYLGVEIASDDEGCYVKMESDSGYDIYDKNYLYPVNVEFIEKVAKKYGVSHSKERSFYLSIDSLDEKEIKVKLGRFATFMDVCALYKYIGYYIFDKEAAVSEYGENYFDKYFHIDNDEFVACALDFEKVKEAVLSSNHWCWVTGCTQVSDGYKFETVFYNDKNEKLTFDVVNRSGKACFQIGLNFDKVASLEKFKSIMLSTLSKIDDKNKCVCDYLGENVGVEVASAICYAMIAANYEFFACYDERLAIGYDSEWLKKQELIIPKQN